MYYRARWYDPQQSRFISEDPIGGMNRYAYAGNNPITHLDPMGTSWSTFAQGLKDGGISGFWEGVKYGLLFGAVSAAVAASGGALAGALLSALTYAMGAVAAAMILQESYALLSEKLCPDELHYRIGHLIGSVVGAILGGVVGGFAGAELAAPRGSSSTLGMNGGGRSGEGSIRKSDYPTRIQKATRERLENAAKDADGNIHCQNCDKSLEPGKGTPEHNPSLVE